MNNLSIYIPTMGRVGHSKQVALRWLKDHSSRDPILVCPPEEAKEHRKYTKKVMACDEPNIGRTRQWIVENAPTSCDIIVMLDDDMRFQYRPNIHTHKLEQCRNLDPMFDLIKKCVGAGFIHGGLGARQGNNHVLSTDGRVTVAWSNLFVDCSRATNFHYLDRRKVIKTGVRFDTLPVMEDFQATLYLLTRGYPNRIIHSYVWNQGFSNQEGGCSRYRTHELQTKAAQALAKLYPDVVKVITKKSRDTSPSWQGMKERTDVRVQWLKAYTNSKKIHD